MPIVMNVGPSATGAASGSGGGQTLGAAHGSITINVNNVTEANAILQQSARQMAQAFANTGRAAQQAAQQQILASRVAAAQAIAASRQQISANRIQISNIAATTAQHTAATKQQTQNVRLAATQQTSAIRVLSAQQRQQSQAAIQGIQQQVAANRLVISNLAAQAAQARATATANRAAAQASITGWQRFNQGLHQVRTELFAIGASATLITGFGFQAAGSIQAARIQLKAMTGSIEEGNALMSELQKRGRAAGVPFQQMLGFATQLLPVLERDTDELLKWFDIVRRTAVLNQSPTVGGVGGATFSLREAFLSVQQGGRDFVSLADRFNISKKALQEALEISGGDFVSAMDLVLDKMGITTKLADEMADSFNAGLVLARDAAFQLAAEGFTPLISVIGPALRLAADFLGTIRQGVPGTLALAAGLLVVTAGGSALLLVVNQLTVAWTRMGIAAQTAITRAGRISLVAGIGILGAELGVRAGASIANAQRRSQGLPERDLNYALVNAVAQTAKALQEVSFALLSFREAVWGIVSSLLRTLARWNEGLASVSPTLGMLEYFSDIAASQNKAANMLDLEAVKKRMELEENWNKRWEGIADWGRSLGIEGLRPRSSGSGDQEAQSLDKRRDAIIEWAEETEKIERDTNRERIKAAIDYGRRVNDVNFSYSQNLIRDAEDFARSRLRQEQQYIREVLKAREESARQEAEWRDDLAKSIADMTDEFSRNEREQQEDHDEKIADIKERSAEKLIEMEEDYQKDRERALRDHRDKILDAAANLDAAAVFEEQKRFAREQEEREDEHKDRLNKEKDNEKDRIADENKNFEKRRKREQEEFDRRLKREQEAFDERLQEAKEADDRRLFDMHEAFEIQRQEEEEDRNTRLARAAEDHARELIQMQVDHDEKMSEISRQEAEKLESLREDHEDELEKLGFHNAAKDKLEEDFFERSLKRHEKYFKDWETREQALMEKELSKYRKDADPSEYQSGGFVRRTGLAKVHAGEYVINPNMTRVLRDMLNGNFTQASMMSPVVNSSSRSSSVTFSGDVSISIMGSTNMGEGQMYSVAKRAIMDSLTELADQ